MPEDQRGSGVFGFFSFTEITDAGEHRAYNEWHQLDHLPQQFTLPGVIFGQRWVSTPACTAARLAASELLSPAHYLTLYLMRGEPSLALDEFAQLARRLRHEQRFFQHRRVCLSGPFAVSGMWAAERAAVSADVVAFRPSRGIYVVVAPSGPSSWEGGPGLVTEGMGVPSVAGAWQFVSDPALAGGRWEVGDRVVTVFFLDGPPLEAAPSLGSRFAAEVPRLEFAGPFETVLPWQWDWFD